MDNVWAQIKGPINYFNIFFSAVMFLNKIIPNKFFSILDKLCKSFWAGHMTSYEKQLCAHGSYCRLSKTFIWVLFMDKNRYLVTTFWKERRLNQELLHIVYMCSNIPQRLFVKGSVGPQQNRGLILYIRYTQFIEKVRKISRPFFSIHHGTHQRRLQSCM